MNGDVFGSTISSTSAVMNSGRWVGSNLGGFARAELAFVRRLVRGGLVRAHFRPSYDVALCEALALEREQG